MWWSTAVKSLYPRFTVAAMGSETTIERVVDERPLVEVFPPILLRTTEVLLNLPDCFSGGNLVRGVDLEQGARRRQVPVVLSITDLAPWAAGHEVVRMGPRHQLFKQMLKPVPFRLQEGDSKILLIIELLNAIHDVQGREQMSLLGGWHE